MRFSPAVDFSGRCIEPLREQFELLNHGFQVSEHALFGRQGHAGHIRHNRPVLDLFKALADDFDALVELLHADPVPIICVAVLADGDAEFTLGVGGIGFVFAKIEINARPS